MRLIRQTLFVFASIWIICGSISQAWAIPNLQIYIPGATYDTATETWVINSYDYELWVIGAKYDVLDVKLAFAVPEDEVGSIDINWLTGSEGDYGYGTSLTMTESGAESISDYRLLYADGKTPDPEEEWGFAYDTVPIMGSGKEINAAPFPTDFYEYFIDDFNTNETVYNYIPGDEELDSTVGQMKVFDISVSGYTWVDIIAYDHVVLSNNNAKYVFSPFSHDGSSISVPEPATMLLLGSGLAGLAGFRRKFKKS